MYHTLPSEFLSILSSVSILLSSVLFMRCFQYLAISMFPVHEYGRPFHSPVFSSISFFNVLKISLKRLIIVLVVLSHGICLCVHMCIYLILQYFKAVVNEITLLSSLSGCPVLAIEKLLTFVCGLYILLLF